jgi:hypothetical protein
VPHQLTTLPLGTVTWRRNGDGAAEGLRGVARIGIAASDTA